MEQPNKGTIKDLVYYRMETAQSDLRAACMLMNEKEYRAANNRAYYAIFHAISAVHALDGKAYKRHKDALANFNKDYIRTEIFPKTFGRRIAEAEEIRHASDYDDFYIATKVEAEEQIKTAKELIEQIEAYCVSRMNEKFQKILDDIKKSTKAVKVLPSDKNIKEELHEKYSINPESLLGVLLENTGGIIIDNWLHFYGTGEIDFIARNCLIPIENIVVAEDILGGLFVYLENDNIGYFAPDCLELEDMEISLSQFLYWCLHGDTDTFYIDYRWTNWQEDISSLDCNMGVAFYPFLWAKAETLESRKRSIVPMQEIIGLEFEFLKQMQSDE